METEFRQSHNPNSHSNSSSSPFQTCLNLTHASKLHTSSFHLKYSLKTSFLKSQDQNKVHLPNCPNCCLNTTQMTYKPCSNPHLTSQWPNYSTHHWIPPFFMILLLPQGQTMIQNTKGPKTVLYSPKSLQLMHLHCHFSSKLDL